MMNRLLICSIAVCLIFLYACSDSGQNEAENVTVKYKAGVRLSYLDLIYEGPKGYTLDLFPREIIAKNAIKLCKVFEGDSIDNRIAKTVHFDKRGNLVKEENDYFSDWENGSAIGTYLYFYDASNRLLEIKGSTTDNRIDSSKLVFVYNQSNYLISKTRHQFSKRLKPGADHHLPGPNDYEEHPTWFMLMTYNYFSEGNNVLIKTIVDNKVVGEEGFDLQFDSLNRLKKIQNFEGSWLIKSLNYSYTQDTIVRNSVGELNGDEPYTRTAKAVLNLNGQQIQKKVFRNGKISSTTSVFYNSNGTISSIERGSTKQRFEYSYF